MIDEIKSFEERKKVNSSPWFCTSPYNTSSIPVTLELDGDTDEVEEFIKVLDELVTLFNDED